MAFDLALAAAFGLMALGALLTTGRPHAALTTAHTVGSRIGWRESYDTGLVVGLGAAVIAAIALVGLAVLVRRRA